MIITKCDRQCIFVNMIVYDRYGSFRRVYKSAIRIENPPPIKYFGYCPIESDDVTLEFETPISPRQIKINRG